MSALPTQPAHGLPVALPLPLPLSDGEPSRVEQYGPPGHWPLAPPGLLSALLLGCGFVGSPDVPAVPDVLCEDEVLLPLLFELLPVDLLELLAFAFDELPLDLLDELLLDVADDADAWSLPPELDLESAEVDPPAMAGAAAVLSACPLPLPLPGSASAAPLLRVNMTTAAAANTPTGRTKRRTELLMRILSPRPGKPGVNVGVRAPLATNSQAAT